MRFFISKSVSQLEEDGKKRTSFRIIKGKNDEIHQIKGTSSSNNNGFNIEENLRKINPVTGKINTKHRQFKIKSSNIISLMKESRNKAVSSKPVKNISLKIAKKPVASKAVVSKAVASKAPSKKVVKSVKPLTKTVKAPAKSSKPLTKTVKSPTKTVKASSDIKKLDKKIKSKKVVSANK